MLSDLIMRRRTLTMPQVVETGNEDDEIRKAIGSNNEGRFGRFGGKYVPEILMASLNELQSQFNSILRDLEFQVIIKYVRT